MRSLPLSLVLVLAAVPVAILGCWLGGGLPPQTTVAAPVAAPVPKVKTATPALAASVPVSVPVPAQAEVAESGAKTALAQLTASLKAAKSVNECRTLSQDIAALGTEDAAEAIWQAATAQKDPELRAAILASLDSVVEPQMITFTASVLKASTDPQILNAAKQLVTRGADMDTVGFLTELYTEAGTTELQQGHIEHAVSTIRTEAAASALGALARNTEAPRLAEAAAVSLHTLGTPATMQELSEARAALAATGGPGVEPLLQGIDRLLNQTTEGASHPEMAQVN